MIPEDGRMDTREGLHINFVNLSPIVGSFYGLTTLPLLILSQSFHLDLFPCSGISGSYLTSAQIQSVDKCGEPAHTEQILAWDRARLRTTPLLLREASQPVPIIQSNPPLIMGTPVSDCPHCK